MILYHDYIYIFAPVFFSNTLGFIFGNRNIAVGGAVMAAISMFATAFAPNIYFVVIFLGLFSGRNQYTVMCACRVTVMCACRVTVMCACRVPVMCACRVPLYIPRSILR